MSVPLIPRELLFGNPDVLFPKVSPDGEDHRDVELDTLAVSCFHLILLLALNGPSV